MEFKVVLSVEMTPEQVEEYARTQTGGNVPAVEADVAEWVAEMVGWSRLQESGLVSFTSIRNG